MSRARRRLTLLVLVALVAGTWPAIVRAASPVAGNDVATVTEDQGPITIQVLENDSDEDLGDVLVVTDVEDPDRGTATITGDGTTIDYTPDADFFGPDVFDYTVTAGGETATATITVTITPVDDQPVALADDYSVDEDGTLTVPAPGVLGNDVDVDGPALQVVETPSGPSSGDLQLDADGGFTYSPDPGFSGTDSFTYRLLSDSPGVTAQVTIEVGAVDDDPTAVADAAPAILEDSPVTSIDVLANDTDTDGGPKVVTGITAQPTRGTAAVASAGAGVTYTPAANQNGADSFTYAITGGSTAAVAVTITPVNDPPSFTKGSAPSGAEDTARSISGWATAISAGPANEAGQSVTFETTSNTNPGLFSVQPAISPTGTLTWTPAANGSGTATVGFRVKDSGGTANAGTDVSPTQTTTITVTPVNDRPDARNDSAAVGQGMGATAVNVRANDLDADGDTLTITGKTNGAKGTVAITGGGTGLTYDPTGILEGSDTFTYTVSDGKGGTDTATVLVTIAHDATKPVVSSVSQLIPSQILATTTANTVLVDWTWAATDTGTGVARYRVDVSVDGGTYRTVTLADPAATTLRRTLTVGREYRFRVRATDRAGNTGAFVYALPMTAVRYQQTTSLATYTGTWSSSTNRSMSGGSGRYTSSASRKVVFTFTGRDVAWVSTRTTSGGRADVLIDGVKVATVDLDASSTQYRRVVFRRHFATQGTHTLEIRPRGDGRVDVDAFVVLR